MLIKCHEIDQMWHSFNSLNCWSILMLQDKSLPPNWHVTSREKSQLSKLAKSKEKPQIIRARILPGKVEVKVVFAMVVDHDVGGSTPVMTFNGSSLTNVCLFSQTVGAVYQRLESHHPARPVIFLPVATYGALPLADGRGQCGVKFLTFSMNDLLILW